MTRKILVTGSHGLIGRALGPAVCRLGLHVVPFDIRATGRVRGDIRIAASVREAGRGCVGIVHLAAVSRVLWGERDPERCRLTNVDGTRVVIEHARSSRSNPWILFASSREVYGRPARLPATEQTALAPVNIYGRSKLEAERLIDRARDDGLATAIVRLSNVYGCPADHPTRVVPAFARAAIAGQPLRVEGADHAFDFTHLDDTIRGLTRVIEALERGDDPLPPIHLTTGRPTTLGALARMAVHYANRRAPICDRPPRTFDVEQFVGNPTRAKQRLGWTASVSIEAGLARLVGDFRSALAEAG